MELELKSVDKFTLRERQNFEFVEKMIKDSVETVKWLEDSRSVLEEYSIILLNYNYPPYADFMVSHMDKIVKYHKQGSEDLEEVLGILLMREFDDEKFESLLKKWSQRKIIKKRIKVLSRAIERHKEKDFLSSISLMLPQIEGIVSDLIVEFYGKSVYLKKDKMEKLSKALFLDVFESKFNLNIWEYYFSKILSLFHHGDNTQNDLNRNAIFHGGSIDYDTEINSVRTFMLFDLISDKIDSLLREVGTIEFKNENECSSLNLRNIDAKIQSKPLEIFKTQKGDIWLSFIENNELFLHCLRINKELIDFKINNIQKEITSIQNGKKLQNHYLLNSEYLWILCVFDKYRLWLKNKK